MTLERIIAWVFLVLFIVAMVFFVFGSHRGSSIGCYDGAAEQYDCG